VICDYCELFSVLNITHFCFPLFKKRRFTYPYDYSNLHGHFTALEGFGDLKIGEQVIRSVKYADDLVFSWIDSPSGPRPPHC
jgi:hypothetical protein